MGLDEIHHHGSGQVGRERRREGEMKEKGVCEWKQITKGGRGEGEGREGREGRERAKGRRDEKKYEMVEVCQ